MLSVQAALRLFIALCSAARGLAQVRLNEVQVREVTGQRVKSRTRFIAALVACFLFLFYLYSQWYFVYVVGTHNSYHQAPPAAIQDLAWNDLVAAIAKNYAQSAVNTTQYDHLNFTAQLDLGRALITSSGRQVCMFSPFCCHQMPLTRPVGS